MGTISLEQTDSLLWLGRYVERVYSTLQMFNRYYDTMLDRDGFAYQELCRQLSIPNIYTDQDDFVTRYMFDRNNPDSVISNMGRAMDNGMVLRNDISSQTLSYLQMSLDTLSLGESSNAHCLVNIEVIDYLLAFWGSIDDNCRDVTKRNIVKAGKHMERLDMALRLGYPRDEVEYAFSKLRRRLTGLALGHRPEELGAIARLLSEPDVLETQPGRILAHLERLFG